MSFGRVLTRPLIEAAGYDGAEAIDVMSLAEC